MVTRWGAMDRHMPPSATYGTFILVSYNNRADVTISFRLLRHLLETTSFVYALLVFGILNPSHHAPSRSVIADMGDTNAGFRVDPKCEVSRRVTKAMHKNMMSLPLIRLQRRRGFEFCRMRRLFHRRT